MVSYRPANSLRNLEFTIVTHLNKVTAHKWLIKTKSNSPSIKGAFVFLIFSPFLCLKPHAFPLQLLPPSDPHQQQLPSRLVPFAQMWCRPQPSSDHSYTWRPWARKHQLWAHGTPRYRILRPRSLLFVSPWRLALKKHSIKVYWMNETYLCCRLSWATKQPRGWAGRSSVLETANSEATTLSLPTD